jgi:hypothetical protein
LAVVAVLVAAVLAEEVPAAEDPAAAGSDRKGKEMKPDKLVEVLKEAAGDDLISVVLYGSAAVGDHAGKRSDYNVLVVTKTLDLSLLNAISKPAIEWSKAGNPAPLMFTVERLQQATDVFPIELLDIRDCHRLLFGRDVVSGLAISQRNLRLQIEGELRGALIKLRQRYLLTQGKEKAVATLMIESLSTFLVLFRAALRLYEATVPQPKLEALDKLAAHISFEQASFQVVHQLKSGEKTLKEVDLFPLFKNYLETIECVIDAVDAFIHKGEEE